MGNVKRDKKMALLTMLQEQEKRIKYNQLKFYRPQKKQIIFHNALESDVCLGAGNQLGKTYAAAHEIAFHLTGLYPDWWEGRRFKNGVKGWVCGRTTEVVRDSLQTLLLGGWDSEDKLGTGSIPRDKIIKRIKRTGGIQGSVDTVIVKHVSGDDSKITFKSYDMGREKFQAATLDFVYLDEEPPSDIYSEARTRTNKGQLGNFVRLTFTPLLGMTDVVMQFYRRPAKHQKLVQFTIDDAEHYTEEEKKAIISGYPEHERDARAKGIPILGSGRIFPVSEEDIKESHMTDLPAHWFFINGLDFGWDHPQACVQIAYDGDNDIIHVIRGKKERHKLPIEMYIGCKAWAEGIPTAWPHDGHQHDKGSGKALAEQYGDAGFIMLHNMATHEAGGNGVEAGISQMLERMKSGRFKVDESLIEWFEEFRLYHREDGKIVKAHDDLISATRYAVMMLRYAKQRFEDDYYSEPQFNTGRSTATGY